MFLFSADMTERSFSNLNVPEVKREPEMQLNISVPVKNERLNGYPDDGGGWSANAAANHDQQCCLIDNGRRCNLAAGNASYNKRIQKTVTQKKLKLHMDNSVSFKKADSLTSGQLYFHVL